MASKSFLNSLRKGEILVALVEELMPEHEVLCNFKGELLLVRNHTGQGFKKGDAIPLQVQALNPLQFQIFSSGKNKFERVV